ncbi:MAG: Asp-tRNA(Asn)/Glu-tRNA(Gln) amidotransferase subunit GatB [Mycoplasma sp.]|nr:Asp-tRNA(Asn)/Glu-tRNA(Gln) amidotransferase subunit GatB [Mycoplasma sp.]
MNNFEVVIGIEIHLELKTNTKVFSSSPNNFGDLENTNVQPLDLGFPGTLPILNKAVVIQGIKLAKALKMNIDNELHFDRKNYYYPDLPKGFQITQQRRPIGSYGKLLIEVEGKIKEISIERIHIEEDTAKQIHGDTFSKLNYNRSGVPLLEIVTEPVIRTSSEAAKYIDMIRQIAKNLNISDAKMEEGSLRADVNISLRPYGQKEFGTKVEIKNMNSISNVEKAIEFEISLQTKKILNNEKITMDTKRFLAENNSTVTMRTKNNATDYKYFPEPNIPIIKLEQDFIDSIEISELPWETKNRLIESGVQPDIVEKLMSDIDLVRYFDSINYKDRNRLSKILFSELIAIANSNNKSLQNLNIDKKEIVKAIKLVDLGEISGKHLKIILPLLVDKQKNVDIIIKENNMKQLSNINELTEMIDIIINDKLILKDYCKRPQRVIKQIIGLLMKKTKGQANPVISNKIVLEKLRSIKC